MVLSSWEKVFNSLMITSREELLNSIDLLMGKCMLIILGTREETLNFLMMTSWEEQLYSLGLR